MYFLCLSTGFMWLGSEPLDIRDPMAADPFSLRVQLLENVWLYCFIDAFYTLIYSRNMYTNLLKNWINTFLSLMTANK